MTLLFMLHPASALSAGCPGGTEAPVPITNEELDELLEERRKPFEEWLAGVTEAVERAGSEEAKKLGESFRNQVFLVAPVRKGRTLFFAGLPSEAMPCERTGLLPILRKDRLPEEDFPPGALAFAHGMLVVRGDANLTSFWKGVLLLGAWQSMQVEVHQKSGGLPGDKGFEIAVAQFELKHRLMLQSGGEAYEKLLAQKIEEIKRKLAQHDLSESAWGFELLNATDGLWPSRISLDDVFGRPASKEERLSREKHFLTHAFFVMIDASRSSKDIGAEDKVGVLQSLFGPFWS